MKMTIYKGDEKLLTIKADHEFGLELLSEGLTLAFEEETKVPKGPQGGDGDGTVYTTGGGAGEYVCYQFTGRDGGH